jgi:hypothetical protein
MRQYWMAPLPPFHTADGTAVTASTITDASPAPPIVIPANMLEVGSRLEFQAWGRLTTTASPGTAFVLGVYLAPPATAPASGNAIAATASLTPKASQTNMSWRLEGNASVRAVGSGTAASIIGLLEVSNITANGTDLAPATAPTALGFDSTVANAVKVAVTIGAASQSFTVHYLGVRLVN